MTDTQTITQEPENGVVFEYQVLAAPFKVPGAIKRFSEEINPEDVGLIHGMTGIHEIYKNLISYHKNIGTDLIDPVGFKAWLHDETDIVVAMGGVAGVDKLMGELMDTELSSLDSIIRMVHYRASKRHQLDKIQQLKEIVANKGQSSEKEIEKIASLTEQIRSLQNDLRYDPFELMRTAYDIIDGIDKLWEIPPFLPTQFKSLNKAMGYSEDKGGFLRGGVHAIIAHSGKGKSIFSRSLCNHWLDQGFSTLYINFEEPQQHWETTMMTQVTGVNVYEQADHLDSVQMSKLSAQFKAKLEEWGDRCMVRHDPDSLYFEDLEKWLRDLIGNDRKIDVVVIDTIQSLFTKSGGKARWNEFEHIMVYLEKLARDMDAVFIVTSQQNNNSLRENKDVLDQSDAGGGVTIAQKATATLFLVEPKSTGVESAISSSNGVMEIQMPKNRITGQIFSGNPPKVQYDDSKKLYIDHKIQDDKYYNEDLSTENFEVT